MSQKTKGMLTVLCGNAIFGFSFLFSKIAMQITIPAVMIATRFTMAFVVLNAIVLVGSRIKKADGTALVEFSLKGKPFKYVLVLALFQPVIYFFAESYGIVYTSSAFAGAIIAVIPIAGIVFDVVLMHSKVTRKQIICAVGSVVGVALTSIGGEMTVSIKGLVCLLIAVVAGALFYALAKFAAPYFNALERTYVMFGIGSVAYIVFALIQARGSYGTLIGAAFANPLFWASILYLSVVSSVIAFLCLNYGTERISVSQASLFANLTTVISIAAGVVILHEAFTIQQLIGAIVILVCVFISTK